MQIEESRFGWTQEEIDWLQNWINTNVMPAISIDPEAGDFLWWLDTQLIVENEHRHHLYNQLVDAMIAWNGVPVHLLNVYWVNDKLIELLELWQNGHLDAIYFCGRAFADEAPVTNWAKEGF